MKKILVSLTCGLFLGSSIHGAAPSRNLFEVANECAGVIVAGQSWKDTFERANKTPVCPRLGPFQIINHMGWLVAHFPGIKDNPLIYHNQLQELMKAMQEELD